MAAAAFAPRGFAGFVGGLEPPPWIRPYLESPWVKALSSLAPDFPPPRDASDGAAWDRYWAQCLGAAAVPLGLGALAALAVFLRSCCCCSAMGFDRPKGRRLLCLGLLAMLLTIAGAAAYLLVGWQGGKSALDLLDTFVDQVNSLQVQGETLAQLASGAAGALLLIEPTCPREASARLRELRQQLERASRSAAAFAADAALVAPKLGGAQADAHDRSDQLVFGLVVPLALVLVCCSVIVHLVNVTRGSRRARGRCGSCCMRCLGPMLFAPVILAVAAITSGEFALTFALGSFCKDADTNVLTNVHHFGNELTFNLTRYYVAGQGRNLLLDEISEAEKLIAEGKEEAETFGPVAKAMCTDGAAIDDVFDHLYAAEVEVANLKRLVEPSEVYRFYRGIVREGACETVIAGMSWLVLSQLIVGLALLPALTCMASRFFEQWLAWRDALAREQLAGGAAVLVAELGVSPGIPPQQRVALVF